MVAERDQRQEQALARAALQAAPDYSVEAAVDFLVARGLNREHVRDGSMPEASLQFAAGILRERLPRGRPLRALHVGNFVGVSLSHFTALAREVNPDSVVVSVDPNIRHQRVALPETHVLALLGHFGLLSNSLVIPGYTLEQNLGDPLPDAPDERYLDERACERVLVSLAHLETPGFDFVVLDGNHDAEYLAREFAALGDVLAPDAIVVFDDVNEFWPGVQAVFGEAVAAADDTVTDLGKDGRVGLLQMHQRAGGAPR
jgi:hypothetical protein